MKDKFDLIDYALFAKSFYLLGDSLKGCFDCSYCRLNGEKCIERHYSVIPTEINPNFTYLPVAINLFYGDPLLQIENTVKYLKMLESAQHKGPVIIVTKGDFSLFPDIPFDLDLHFAFSTFGVNSKYDGSSMEIFENNLKEIEKRVNNYKYSIEYRPICYNINDSVECIERVFKLANEYGLSIGYSGLQGKEASVKIWESEGINLNPYPGYKFGHKKSIDEKIIRLFELYSDKYNVPIFRKTSCLFSYVHDLPHDYNAHYYRPNEVNCEHCVIKEKCLKFKNNLRLDTDLSHLISFEYEIIEKEKHECILKKQGICEFPTNDCSNISGKIIKINDLITTSDVRVIKWLTGYTVDASFVENPSISKCWLKNKELIKR